MPEQDPEKRCPVCRKPVFTAEVVLRCVVCGQYQHDECSVKGRCGRDCKGKTERTVVVRLEHAGPNAFDIAEAVDARVKDLLAPIDGHMEASATVMQTLIRRIDGLETAQREARVAASGDLEGAVKTLNAALQSILRVARDIDKRTLYQPKPLDQKTLESTFQAVADRVQQLTAQESEHSERRLAQLRTELIPELRRAVKAIDACRFDVVSARHPLPWHTESTDVLAPAPSTRGRAPETTP